MDLMSLVNVLDCDFMGCPAITGGIPSRIVNVAYMIITILKFGVPVLLIIFGMLDLGKAVIASKEDEIKKGQQTFIKRIIAAVIVFFVVAVVQLVVSIAAEEGESATLSNCINAFVHGVDETTCKVNK